MKKKIIWLINFYLIKGNDNRRPDYGRL